MGHSSGSDSEGSDKEKKHSKHDKKDKKDKHDKEGKHKDDKHKEDKHKEVKHKEDKHKQESSGLSSHLSGIIPGHEKYGGKLKKEDVQNLKHRTDISEEEREHRRKVMMAEVAAGVVGTGVLGFAGYQAYQHFSSKDEDKAHVQHKEA